MSDLSIRLPDSLYKHLHVLTQADGISIDQFVASAIAEKIAALTTETDLEELAQQGSRAAYDAVLAKVPDVEPDVYDRRPLA
jgi:hypothetical protein